MDDLADYGLDTPWFSITVTDLDGSSRTLHLGDLVEGDDIHYYCTIDDTNDVFTISTSYLAFAEDFQVTHYLDMSASRRSTAWTSPTARPPTP